MNDRLQELLRQKALLQEHAAWLDGEIAAELARAGSAETPARASAAPPTTAGSADAEADAIIEQYRDSSQSIHQQVKRGCILYLVAAFLLLAGSVVAIYFLYRRG